MKLYIYGYLNRVQSSRRLEREAGRNVEVMRVLQSETLDAVADRGYFNSPEILACHEAGITVTLCLPKRPSDFAPDVIGT